MSRDPEWLRAKAHKVPQPPPEPRRSEERHAETMADSKAQHAELMRWTKWAVLLTAVTVVAAVVAAVAAVLVLVD